MQKAGELHFHKCGMQPGDIRLDGHGCGHLFEHVRPPSGALTDAEYDAHHACPKCGRGPWLWVWSAEGERIWTAMSPAERDEVIEHFKTERRHKEAIEALVKTLLNTMSEGY